MRAYRKPGQSICFGKWKEFFSEALEWRVLAGAQEQDSLGTISEKLKIKWD